MLTVELEDPPRVAATGHNSRTLGQICPRRERRWQVNATTLNTTPHLNRAKVKQTALEIAGQTRGQGWTRVGMTFLQRIEAATHAAIVAEVRRHPSKGKTLL